MADETTTTPAPTPAPEPTPTPAPAPKPDASATPAGEVWTDEIPAPPPGWTTGAWREHYGLRQKVKAAEAARAAAETRLATVETESQAQLSAARRAAEEAAAFARAEALHPVVSDPEVRDELRQAFDRYAKREGDKAVAIGVWLADVAPKSKLYGHLFAAPAPAVPNPAAPVPPVKTDPNAAAQNTVGAPPSGKMTVEAFKQIKNPTAADVQRLVESSGLRLSPAMIEAISKRG